MVLRARVASKLLFSGLILLLTLCLSACAGGGTATVVVTATPQTPAVTATPVPECIQIEPGSTPFTSLNGLGGLTLPAGAYITSPSYTGGGTGQYRVTTYTACFHGSEAAIDGFSNSTLSHLKATGWALNNLFPDTSNFTTLDICSNSHNCVNSKGVPYPFTFIGFSQYAPAANGYTTFTLQVATISKPSCLNDPNYYSGTPKYTLYYDGNSASSSGTPQDHFVMPPATRVSTFQGGGAAGSTYVFFCSAGTASQVVGFLKQSMTNAGWSISGATASSFTASYGTSPLYRINVSVSGPNNYYLQVFAPM
jgi:hypothetical protein